MEQIRTWLSVNLIDLGIRICPYPEMQEYLKQGLCIAIEKALEDDEDESK